MTAADDIVSIRAGYAAWNRGELSRLLELMTDDVEIVPVLGDVVSADRFRGHAGVTHWYETVNSTLEDFRADIEDVVEVGDQRYLVKLRFSGHGRASGAPVALNAAHLMTLDPARWCGSSATRPGKRPRKRLGSRTRRRSRARGGLRRRCAGAGLLRAVGVQERQAGRAGTSRSAGGRA